MGGMFSASGPYLGWFGHRQPPHGVSVTLLACFILTTSTPILVGAGGDLTREVLTLVYLAYNGSHGYLVG